MVLWDLLSLRVTVQFSAVQDGDEVGYVKGGVRDLWLLTGSSINDLCVYLEMIQIIMVNVGFDRKIEIYTAYSIHLQCQ